MLYFIVAFGLFAHVFFWGTGLALMAMPRPWRRFWPILAGPAGFALQSTVIWIAAYADLPGARSYGWASELIPIILLAAGLQRRGWQAARDMGRLGGVWLVCIVSLGALVWPLAHAAKRLTTASLGNCDAADFAAGGRVLMEFAHHDRTGFLGLTEVVHVLSVDNFFDFWLRLNHFTPAALIALNGVIFNRAPYEITGLLATVMLAASVPVVFWMGRALMGYRGWTSIGIAALYGFSPIPWYAVYQVAAGQLLAAPAIALITWLGIAAWHRSLEGRQRLAFAGILAVAYTLILGSYNFIVVFCLIPALGYAIGLAIWQARWRHFGRWLLTMLVPLVAMGAVFWTRVVGIVDRFTLFRAYDFGWKIPALTPEGCLGLIRTVNLDPLSAPRRWILTAVAVAALIGALWHGARRMERAAFAAICLIVPVMGGYGLLHWSGDRISQHASYDAYKLLAVFYAGMLPAMCYWVRPVSRRLMLPVPTAPQRRFWRRAGPFLALGCLVGAQLLAAGRFQAAMKRPPLIVDQEMVDIGRVENMPSVSSLNMRVPDMWSRLWASQFLLRRPQYFPTHTYEGHLNTPLRGAWDLSGGLVTVTLPGEDSVRLNAQFSLARVGSPWYLRAMPHEGWYPPERLPRSNARWRWSKGDASLAVENPQEGPLMVKIYFDARSLIERELVLWIGGRRLGSVHIGTERHRLALLR